MKKHTLIMAAAALMMAATSCDKIDNPRKPYTPTGGGKTVLIKDFTGVRCVNCPEAATTVHQLQHELGADRVFIMSVHAGFLAQPIGNFPDFTTEEGTQWYGENNSNPLFAVNRSGLIEGHTYTIGQIDTPVSDELGQPQVFEVSIENTFDEASRLLKVDNTLTALGDVDGDFHVTVCLVEDSLVGMQTVPGGIDREYVFRNVFRATLNGADGTAFANGHLYVDDTFRKSFSMELDTTFNADQCYVMTYISDKAQGDKILQTAMEKIK